MRQHSVAWAYVASIPLATAAILVSITISDRDALGDLDGAASKLNPSSHSLIGVGDSMIPGESGYVVSVPRNSLVVVGSLDLSGVLHIVTVDSDLLSFDSRNRQLADSHQSLRNCATLSSSDITLPHKTLEVATTTVSCLPSQPKGTDFCVDVAPNPDAVTVSVPHGPRIRRFRVPHFEQTAIVNETGDATLVAQSARVSVYLDDSMYGSGTQPQNLADGCQMIECANEVCRHLEATVVDQVSRWVGEVADLDADQRLSVVITDLDRRSPVPETPVLGCVRDGDFLGDHEADFSGDILYLDRRIPNGKSLVGLLAHELTHAAVFSLMLQSRASLKENNEYMVPSWLNEATAHLVEGSVCDDRSGFAERIRQFRADASASPIVASESYLSFNARRGGSRASGALFLRQLAGTPHELRRMIQSSEPIDKRVESITGRSFSEVFRAWSAGQAQTAQICAPASSAEFAANGGRFSQRVFGTAYFCLRCEEPTQNLLIASDSKAELQITVIEQTSDSHQ